MESQRPDKLRVLFLCTGNSCRSQMAEGWARHLKGGEIEPASAGTEARGKDPLAVRVMAEAGVTIDDQRSKTVDELGNAEFEYVVTVCDRAAGSCPWFPATTRVLHNGFDDPPALTAELDDEQERLAVYRRVRDEIRTFVEAMPASLQRD